MRHGVSRVGGPLTLGHLLPHVELVLDVLERAIVGERLQHVEHHLFPTVPTCHLPKLAERLDEVAPELKTKLVF